MQSGSEIKNNPKENNNPTQDNLAEEKKLTIEDIIPICPISADFLTEIPDPIIASCGNVFSETALKDWISLSKQKTVYSPVNPSVVISDGKPVKGTVIQNHFKDMINAYKKLELEKNELLEKLKKLEKIEQSLKISSQLDEKNGALPRKETRDLSQLTQLIQQKEREQAAAIFTRKILIRNLLRKEKDLKAAWNEFKHQREKIKLKNKNEDEKYKEIMFNLVQQVPPLLDTFKKLPLLAELKKENSFEVMDKVMREWEVVRQSHRKEMQALISPRAQLIRKTLSAAYAGSMYGIDLQHEFSHEMEIKEEEKKEQEKIRINTFVSKKLEACSYEKRWERLNILIQDNANQLKKLKEEATRQSIALSTKLQEEQLKGLSLFGGVGKVNEIKVQEPENKLMDRPVFKRQAVNQINHPNLWKAIQRNNLMEAHKLLTESKVLYTDFFDTLSRSIPLICKLLMRQEALDILQIERIKKIIDYLTDCGENINRPDKEGDTPLHWAAYYNNFELVKYLVSKGADPNSKNKYRLSPAEEAYNYNSATKVKIREYLEAARKDYAEKYSNMPPAFAPAELNGGMRPR